jgi:hypothetical protein
MIGTQHASVLQKIDSVESITKDFSMSEQIKRNRRRFLGTAVMNLAAAQAWHVPFCGRGVQKGRTASYL